MTPLDFLENALIDLAVTFGFYLLVKRDVRKDKEASMAATQPRLTTPVTDSGGEPSKET